MKVAIGGLAIVLVLLAQTVGIQPHATLMPKSDGSATNELRFRELAVNGQNFVGLHAPNNLANSYGLAWPAVQPAENQVLRHTTAGQFEWYTVVPYVLPPLTGDNLTDGTVQTVDLADAAVVNAKLGPGAVTSDKVADGNLGGVDFADASIPPQKLIGESLTGAYILNASLTTDDLADGTVNPIDVHVALRTEQFSWVIYDPTADIPATFDISRIYSTRARNIHMTEVQCDANAAGTVISVARDDGSPSAISNNVTCDGIPQGIFAGESPMTIGFYLNHDTVTAPAGLRKITVTVTYTID